MITDFLGCETQRGHLFIVYVSAVYLVVSGKELDEDTPKNFLSFCSRSHARKKMVIGYFEYCISKIQLKGNFDESMNRKGYLNYTNK